MAMIRMNRCFDRTDGKIPGKSKLTIHFRKLACAGCFGGHESLPMYVYVYIYIYIYIRW